MRAVDKMLKTYYWRANPEVLEFGVSKALQKPSKILCNNNNKSWGIKGHCIKDEKCCTFSFCEDTSVFDMHEFCNQM